MDKLMLVVRCAKAPTRNYHFIFKTPADEGSEFFSRRSNLDWVHEIQQPVRIDISSNWLTNVDLTPLGSCRDLEYLSLAVNKLEKIDLTPLQDCKHLRHLDLSHNKFKNIDLTPIAGCENLVYLYLQENMFDKVNIAPLLDLKQLTTAVIQLTQHSPRPKLVIDSFMSNVPPNLNDVLFGFYTGRRAGVAPDWLYDKNTEVEYSPRSYRELVVQFGWARLKEHLLALSKKLKIDIEFAAQKVLLQGLGMPELSCYDGRVRNIVRLLPSEGDYDAGLRSFYTKMVHLLESQLKRGGSTLYFDLDTLSTTPASVLLPSVLERRDTEMHEVVLVNWSGKIDLLPLWLTSYGNKILIALGFERYASESRMSEINNALKGINHNLAIKKVEQDINGRENQQYPAGHVIQTHIRQMVAT